MSASAARPLPPSLYAETAIAAPDLPRLEGKARATVGVIGGGITGLSTALHLAERGIDVALVEAHEPGWGASGRNGGQVNPGLKPDPDDVERDFGELGQRMVRFSYAAPEALFRLVERHQLRCEARQAGTLRAATNAKTLSGLAKLAAQYERRGLSAQLLDAAAAAEATGTVRYTGILRDPTGGSVQPLGYARGLAKAATSAGARIFAASPATALLREAGGWRITTPNGVLSAERLVIGTNGYSDDLWPKLRRSVVPLFSGITATEKLPEAVAATIMPGGGVLYELGHITVYYRVDVEGRLLMGGRSASRDLAGPDAFGFLQDYARRLWPALTGVRWTHGWNGQLAMTPDHYPHLHEPEPDVLIALGYNGRGVAMATAMGGIIARRIAGEAPDTLDMPVTAITPMRLHALWPLAVQGTIAWGRLRDRLGV
ncbi:MULTISPECIES: FAD-binding oxidoreductase [unclassified Acidisoma]|jgi:glycine/D-amino acid oxidase-like deaminating enzyme|uniref:NAD(P)/FAD-dependent oxidoreductase n=1 Tax=unclassified Acidisoma TaxID=2634065 RepID=UPI00131B5226|nr:MULTISPECIES: FAD-binding oxidoreductase [unclassified Acidisoma]